MTPFGIVYLIQPAELVGTSRFKVGCSAKNTINRVANGYRKGTRCIYIIECTNPFGIEKILKAAFTTNFKLIAGKEYFEGDEIAIKTLFKTIVFDDKFIDVDSEPPDNKSSDASHTEDEDSDKSELDEPELDEEVERVIEVTTYADYIKYSRVTDIIITNKKYVHGYIKLEGNIYFNFIDSSDQKEYSKEIYIFNSQPYTYKEIRKAIPYYIEYNNDKTKYYTINRDYEYIGYDNIKSLRDIEPLYELFERKCLFGDSNKPWESVINFDVYIKKYIQLTKDMIKINESVDINENSNITHINGKNEWLGSLKEWLERNEDGDGVLYDYNKIIADIQKTCYTKNPELYIPKYNEYILDTYTDYTYVVLDTHTFKTMNINNNKIILNTIENITLFIDGTHNINTDIINNIDTSIIDNLMNAYVTDKTHILNFKKLCKSIFIQPSTIPIVFNDTSDIQHSLVDMVDQILCSLKLPDKTLDFFNGYKDKDLRSHIKTNGIPRLLRIYDVEQQQNISKFTNLGIINIVKVNISQSSKKIYSIENYSKWYITNKDIIDKHCIKPPINYNINELLYTQGNLFWHFFKWCCVD